MGRKRFRNVGTTREALASVCRNCGAPVYARDLCQRHYMAAYRKGLKHGEYAIDLTLFEEEGTAHKALAHIARL
jgi:hypothetical protein